MSSNSTDTKDDALAIALYNAVLGFAPDDDGDVAAFHELTEWQRDEFRAAARAARLFIAREQIAAARAEDETENAAS